jgi:hypothetical protein
MIILTIVVAVAFGWIARCELHLSKTDPQKAIVHLLYLMVMTAILLSVSMTLIVQEIKQDIITVIRTTYPIQQDAYVGNR